MRSGLTVKVGLRILGQSQKEARVDLRIFDIEGLPRSSFGNFFLLFRKAPLDLLWYGREKEKDDEAVCHGYSSCAMLLAVDQ